MIDPVQLVLLLIIVILAILLVVLGIQVFLILRELKKTIGKASNVLDNIDSISESIEGPVEAISSIALAFKAGSFLSVAKFIKDLLGDREGKKRERE